MSRLEYAVRLAIGAEAYALLSQWNEAQTQYQRAIDNTDSLTIKRSWWFNLASIALKANDDTNRRAALQAVLQVSSHDDISRRVLELQSASSRPRRLRSTGTKAN